MNEKKVMVGMSGGVDSSAAAALLINQGFSVSGVTLKLFDKGELSESDISDAKSVCEKLKIEHCSFSLEEYFDKMIIQRFISSYENGETPNPCVNCNKYIKFAKMLEFAEENGFDYIATGHYVKKEYDESTGRYLLKKAEDEKKDQTYFLYNMTQHQLEKTLFPLGNYSKAEIRGISESLGLANAKKPDSQDICFVPGGDYVSFIESYTKKKSPCGNFINSSGEILGTHKGLINYTIGQRKGLGITFGEPRFVVGKSFADNTVTLGKHEELFSSEMYVRDVNWIMTESLKEPMRVKIKARYKQPETDATIYPVDENTVRAVFDTPQRAISPGQSAVFYSGDYVVGGGVIK